MPYRRLPNTNTARLNSLKKAVDISETLGLYDLAFSYKTLEDARGFLFHYSRAMGEYKQSLKNQAATNQKYQKTIHTARLYVSHFIQVLNMCVSRKEIKIEHKLLYGLKPESSVVPDLMSDENLYEWGKKIIEGERQRIQQGGAPIYNPAIAKVRVHYDIFVESYNNQKVLQSNTARTIENISQLNETADALILEIWDQVEASFAKLPQKERIEKCREYGVIYYYRKGEKED